VFDLTDPPGPLAQIPIVAQRGVKLLNADFARGDILMSFDDQSR
jgi:hypothetical protein